MSIADLLRALVEGGTGSFAIVGATPLAIGGLAWWLAGRGRRQASQRVANLGIALGLAAVLVLLCALGWLSHAGTSVITGVPVAWMLAPAWLLGAAIAIEHALHPGRQEAIRARVRRGLVIVGVVALLYWLLSGMRVWMLVHTGVLGLLLFLAVLVALGWVMIRRAI